MWYDLFLGGRVPRLYIDEGWRGPGRLEISKEEERGDNEMCCIVAFSGNSSFPWPRNGRGISLVIYYRMGYGSSSCGC